jgi:hypothetical protein
VASKTSALIMPRLCKGKSSLADAKPVEIAAGRTNDPEGFFTTTQLRSGARSASNVSQFATGGALMQDVANNADLQARDLGRRRATDLTKAGTEVLGKPLVRRRCRGVHDPRH